MADWSLNPVTLTLQTTKSLQEPPSHTQPWLVNTKQLFCLTSASQHQAPYTSESESKPIASCPFIKTHDGRPSV